MNSFPLIRTRWSNEWLMSLLIFVLVLYLLPRMISKPEGAGSLALLLAFSLAADTVINFLRYKRPVCAVSAAVTALILYILSPGAPVWAQLAALMISLTVGKHIWGGTGKNPLNPAILGVFLLSLLFPVEKALFEPSVLVATANVVSLPFLLMRPAAGIGMLAGMTAALILRDVFSLTGILGAGLLFWPCLVITDPVTVTGKPVWGGAAGVLAGFVPMLLGGTVTAMSLGILAVNLISCIADRLVYDDGLRLHLKFGNRHRIIFSDKDIVMHDLTGIPQKDSLNTDVYSAEDILSGIERGGVYGFGGAAYPTSDKLRAVIDSKEVRHLIINGAECDPGLVHDKWLLSNRFNDIIKGINLLGRCIDFSSVTIAAKDVSSIAVNTAVTGLHKVPDYYPAGAERLLIREVLGIDIPYNEIPAKKGVLVLNVQTVIAIYEAVCLDRKAVSRYITVADTDTMTGCVARITLGDRVSEIVKKLFERNALSPGASNGTVFIGGGIMHAGMADDDATADSRLNFIAVGKYPRFKNSPQCSKCGLCRVFCPAGLDVRRIADLIDSGKEKGLSDCEPEKCVSCGACSYICLAGRSLSASVERAKNM